MLEPVQNCFTFYHPDGVSSAHDYSESDLRGEGKNNTRSDKKSDPRSIIAQQDLPLSSPASSKKIKHN